MEDGHAGGGEGPAARSEARWVVRGGGRSGHSLTASCRGGGFFPFRDPGGNQPKDTDNGKDEKTVAKARGVGLGENGAPEIVESTVEIVPSITVTIASHR